MVYLLQKMNQMKLLYDEWSSPAVPVEQWLSDNVNDKQSLVFTSCMKDGYCIECNEKSTTQNTELKDYLIIDITSDFQFFERFVMKNEAKLSIIAIMLNIPNYEYPVDVKGLPSIVWYDVPRLNQNMVPVIGHEMCSATTSAMLLKFKGFDFKDKDAEFEHRYVASLVADPGHRAPMYGNWVYNTAAMGAFGLDAYCARTYSWEELKYHLATVGPVGASIKGDTGIYKTGGHLLVVVGYKEVGNNKYVLCNDPNINGRFGKDKYGNDLFVYVEYPLDVFMNFYRGVMYVVE